MMVHAPNVNVPPGCDVALPRIEFVLLNVAFCVPFCSVARLPPNGAFWGEWLAVLLFACWLASRVWRASGSVRSPTLVTYVALAFPALAGLIALQIAFRLVLSTTESMVAVAVLLLAGWVCIASTSMLHEEERPAALRAAAWGLLVALVVNAAAMVLGWTGHGVILFEFAQTGVDRRAVGLIGQANQLGTLTVLAFAAATYLKGQRCLPGWIWVTTVALAALVCAASGSRIAGVEWVMAMALAWWLGRGADHDGSRVPTSTSSRRDLSIAAAVFLGAQVAWAWLAPALLTTAQTVTRGGSTGRFEMLRDGLEMWWKHPWLGVGNGNYAGVRLFELTGFLSEPHSGNAHNLLIQVLAEWGPAGLFIVGLAMWSVLQAVLRRVRQTSADGHAFAATGALCLLAHSMTEHPLWFANLLLPFAFFAGLLCLPVCIKLGRTAPLGRPFAIAVGVAVLAAGTASALDYARIQTLAMRVYAQGFGAPDRVSRNSLAEVSRIAVATLHPTETAVMQGRAFRFDTEFADFKFAAAERALKGVPSPETVARYVAFAALSGRHAAGQALFVSLKSRNEALYTDSIQLLAMFGAENPLIAASLPTDSSQVVTSRSRN